MRTPVRGLASRFLTVAVLLVLAGAFLGAPASAGHRHDGPGLYDPHCPLAALAAVDRTSVVIGPVAAAPVAVASALVVLPLVVRPVLTPAADVCFRAPPTR